MGSDYKKPKALLVDEDKFLLGIYCNKLIQEGWWVDYAMSEQEARMKLKNSSYDVVVIDFQVGKLPGTEVLKDLKGGNLLGKSKIVILTNSDKEEDIDKAQELGADGYIVKAHNTPAEVAYEIGQIYK